MEEELEKTDWQIVNSWLGTLYPSFEIPVIIKR